MTSPGSHPQDSFTHRYVPALKRTVHRLGLAGNYGINHDEFRRALDMGPQYVFWTPRMKEVTPALRDALKQRREHFVIATGPTLGLTAGALRSAVEEARKLLQTDYVDILQLFWLGKTSAWTDGTRDELLRQRELGHAKAIGVSIHDRPRAGEMVQSSPLDLFMLRYNACHPGIEQDVFPHLPKRDPRPAILAYTATAWGKLLSAPSDWTGPRYTAGDCYRFALSNPNVDMALCGPANLAQLQENLQALERGPMSPDELAQFRAFGARVKDSSAQLRWGMD
jgi:aryl-alcohol dehydrogenase-like predicted oxidoreductase